MSSTLKASAIVLIITGIVMICVGACSDYKITEYIAVGVLMLALGIAGFIFSSALSDGTETINKPDHDEKVDTSYEDIEPHI